MVRSNTTPLECLEISSMPKFYPIYTSNLSWDIVNQCQFSSPPRAFSRYPSTPKPQILVADVTRLGITFLVLTLLSYPSSLRAEEGFEGNRTDQTTSRAISPSFCISGIFEPSKQQTSKPLRDTCASPPNPYLL